MDFMTIVQGKVQFSDDPIICKRFCPPDMIYRALVYLIS